MPHRRLGIAAAAAGQGEEVIAAPVAGRLPAALLQHGPALAHPEFGAAVAPVGDEVGVGGVGHQSLGQGEGFQPHLVAWGFIVEVEAAAGMTDRHQAAVMVVPAAAGWAGVPASPGLHAIRTSLGLPLPKPLFTAASMHGAPGPLEGRLRPFGSRVVDGFERVAGEAIEQVHQQQLLVLLFVLQAQLHQLQEPGRGGRRRIAKVGQQLLEGGIDAVAPDEHRIDRRTAQQAPLRAGMAGADGVVVAVEQVSPAGVGWFVGQRGALQSGAGWVGSVAASAIPHQGRPQQELLEEPGGVSEMPLRRAGIGHALQSQILRFQRRDQGLTTASHPPVSALQLCEAGRGCG